ncbi:hypothetical protein CDEST_05583 [Colletotrichum destructivum]|uniref:Uncharacterized protein n=1 Tax=Colletotrichum destructivum TaxID=34406 RepID=A0AAX4IB47_9PEZI|nr:hypothetical protein CDEST_05583 [Colletotrichum destructivum]
MMKYVSILALLTASLASFADAACQTRTTACSPLQVCKSMSGAEVCGTTETVSGTGCTLKIVSGEDNGEVTCNCCS